MSRIGKNPVPIPDGVTVEISGRQVTAKRKLGELHATLMEEVEVKRDGGQIVVRPRDDSDRAQQLWGTARSFVNNLVSGVAEGFTRGLEITFELNQEGGHDVHSNDPHGPEYQDTVRSVRTR